MSNLELHHKISYIEFKSTDIERTKQFYGTVFGWKFKDWGPDYIDCNAADSGLAIGFAKDEPHEGPGKFAPLAVLYSSDLAATEAAILAAGGSIVVPTFEFPGGRRFHFDDGTGNVLAVWSE
ncbi:MAG: VOC family protein [Terracidiphilus sp.]